MVARGADVAMCMLCMVQPQPGHSRASTPGQFGIEVNTLPLRVPRCSPLGKYHAVITHHRAGAKYAGIESVHSDLRCTRLVRRYASERISCCDVSQDAALAGIVPVDVLHGFEQIAANSAAMEQAESAARR